MFDRASIVRPLRRCRIVAGDVNRDGRRATRRAAPAYTRSVHVHRAAEPYSPASPASRRTHVWTANQVACVQFDVAAARGQQRAARRSSPHFFPGRCQSPYSSLISCHAFFHWLLSKHKKYIKHLFSTIFWTEQAYNNLYNYYPEFLIGDAYTAHTLYSHSSYLLKIKFNK